MNAAIKINSAIKAKIEFGLLIIAERFSNINRYLSFVYIFYKYCIICCNNCQKCVIDLDNTYKK